ncbi:MAG: DUF2975 domain-containing protein [Methylobacteriaceae bacterium]|nr:DUF2975 domain-containing protein [Methylobacteriaceae bacterium]
MRLFADLPATAAARDLRARIGWLCHGLRLAVGLWAAWTLALILWLWRSPDAVAATYGGWWKLDLSALPATHYVAGLGLVLADWALVAVLCVMLWRLFGLYLEGEVFTRAATTAMRQVGLVALAAIAFDFLARPAVSWLLTMHLPAGAQRINLFARPEDLLHLLFAGFVLALAHIFRAAADMAEDQAGIV